MKIGITCLALGVLAASAHPQAIGGYFGPLLDESNGTWPGDLCGIHGIHLKGGKFLLWGYGVNLPSESTETWRASISAAHLPTITSSRISTRSCFPIMMPASPR